MNIQQWQKRNDKARGVDQDLLHKKLSDLEKNHKEMAQVLGAGQSSIMAMMVSLQRRLDQHLDSNREQRFLSHSLQYLHTSSGRQIQLEEWMITTHEVDFGEEIGSGGL